MVSIKNIAADIGVSVATVSNALSGKGRVSQALADRIKARAEELGYQPNLAGRALQGGRTGILGLVMPDLTNPLFPRIAQGLASAADDHGIGVLIADSRGIEQEQTQALKRLVARGADGILIIPQKGTVPHPVPVPVVVINAVSDPNNSISADHHGGGGLVARHIADLGHRNVRILGGDQVSEVQRDRVAGMTQMFGADVAYRVLWGEPGIGALGPAIEAGATAILTTTDLMALRVHSELRRLGLSVPDDVSLTGFDDMSFATAMHPSLTTVSQDVRQIAERAVAMIRAMIDGQSVPELGQTVPMRLIERQSTSQPPQKSNQGCVP